MANILPFRFNNKSKETFKAVVAGDALHTDEQGRHLIFRKINGRVRPIRVSAEDFAEWLSDQNININPADQKTLREIDKELQIMERAAEYGGPALQKQYEDYFNQRRQQYAQISQGYYQQALANQAKAAGMTPEKLQERNVGWYQSGGDVVNRESLDARGWDTSLQMWVNAHDQKYNLTTKDTNWYHNRIMAALVYPLIKKAKSQTPLSEIDINNMFSDEYVAEALKESYGMFFGGEKIEPKQVVAAIKTVQKHFREDIRNNREVMSNFINYWYGRMYTDFGKEQELINENYSPSEAMSDIPEGIVPKELPPVINTAEASALMGMYNKSRGSKLNAAHRVILHGMGRVIDSIPLNERVSAAVELSSGKSGLHAVHKEAYKRIYHDYTTLGIMPNRDELVQEAVTLASKIGQGTTKQKVATLKRISMILGSIDGISTLNSNPGIQENQFNRKWNDVSINALRVKSEGPGLIESLLDDEKRAAGIYTNQDLKIIHSPKKEPVVPEKAKDSPKEGSKLDLGGGYTFSGKKMLTPGGYSVEFSPTNQGYASLLISPPSGAEPFESRVYMPPISFSNMSKEDRYSYLESMKSQIDYMIKQYEKNNPPSKTEVPVESKSPPEEVGEISAATVNTEGASFRIPIFDFGGNLTHGDRNFLGEVIQHVDEGGLDVKKTAENIFRVTNPTNGKFLDIVFNTGKKKLMLAGRDEKGNFVPIQEPSIEDFRAQIGYRSSVKPTATSAPDIKPEKTEDAKGITVKTKNGTFTTPTIPGQQRLEPNEIFAGFTAKINPEFNELIYGISDLLGHGLSAEFVKDNVYIITNEKNDKRAYLGMDKTSGMLYASIVQPGSPRVPIETNLPSLLDGLDFVYEPLPNYY